MQRTQTRGKQISCNLYSVESPYGPEKEREWTPLREIYKNFESPMKYKLGKEDLIFNETAISTWGSTQASQAWVSFLCCQVRGVGLTDCICLYTQTFLKYWSRCVTDPFGLEAGNSIWPELHAYIYERKTRCCTILGDPALVVGKSEDTLLSTQTQTQMLLTWHF